MEEIWRPVKDYEGYYEVSNLGRVRSIDRVVVDTVRNCERLLKFFWHIGTLSQNRREA